MRISKDPAERRKEIIHQARLLFFEQGVENTSIAQIAKSIGVAKGLVYYYFRTKEEVIDSVVEEICQEHVDEMSQRIKEEGETFYDQLLILVDAYYNMYPFRKHEVTNRLEIANPLFILFHKRFIQEAQPIYEAIIQSGQKLGFFQENYPEEMLLIALEGVFGLSNFRPISQQKLFSLLEQTLGLPKDSLAEAGVDLDLHLQQKMLNPLIHESN